MQVEILVATFNGAPYLPAQMESLLHQQTSASVRILIGDDGSTDATGSIIADFCVRHPGTIQALGCGPGRGAAANFGRLLDSSRADYVFLCDQDDIWDADKVESSLQLMRDAERAHGKATPLLVFSDLRVVDRDLNLVAQSFWRYQNLDGHAVSLLSLVMQNVVTGCTCLLNRALLSRALPLPDSVLMHDHWLALVAAATGRLLVLPRPTVSYRQHGGNEVGARAWSMRYVLRRARQLLDRDGAANALLVGHAQVQDLMDRLVGRLDERSAEELTAFLSLPHSSRIDRLRLVWRYGWRRQSVVRTLGWLWLLLWAKRIA